MADSIIQSTQLTLSVLNNNVPYSTNAEMLSGIANYVGNDSVHSFVKFFIVRCSEAPSNGSAINFIYFGSNAWGGGVGWLNGTTVNPKLVKIGFTNRQGSIVNLID